jgi:hypothetical protein
MPSAKQAYSVASGELYLDALRRRDAQSQVGKSRRLHYRPA